MTADRLVSVVIPVYRDGARALAAADAMLAQHLPAGIEHEILLVDDGSGDGTPDQLAACTDPRVRVLRLERNQGRSAARNAGASVAHGSCLVFMDCDCLPLDTGFLAAHWAALAEGAVASTGDVTGFGGGFWERYQQQSSSRRARQHATGVCYSGSSQNLAVDRTAFERVGGFDAGYRRYGFEDRDLLLRLGAQGTIAWTPAARVQHLDVLDLAQVSRKMREAGEYSSARFAAQHPAAYSALGYAALDVHLRPWLRLPARLVDPLLAPAASGIDRILGIEAVPFALTATLVRGLTGLSYLAGTLRAARIASASSRAKR